MAVRVRQQAAVTQSGSVQGGEGSPPPVPSAHSYRCGPEQPVADQPEACWLLKDRDDVILQ